MTNVRLISDAAPLYDVPAKLRELADRIEAGERGAVQCCALVLLADNEEDASRRTTAVYGWGPSSTSSQVHLALHAGMLLLASNTADQEEEDE